MRCYLGMAAAAVAVGFAGSAAAAPIFETSGSTRGGFFNAYVILGDPTLIYEARLTTDAPAAAYGAQAYSQITYYRDGFQHFTNTVVDPLTLTLLADGFKVDFTGEPSTGDTFNGDIDERVDFAFGGDTPDDADHRWHLTISLASDVNGPGVPEPTTWLLMLFGFGVVGSALRLKASRTAAGRLS